MKTIKYDFESPRGFFMGFAKHLFGITSVAAVGFSIYVMVAGLWKYGFAPASIARNDGWILLAIAALLCELLGVANMNVEELFQFLIRDYGMQYCRQVYEKCWGGNWTVYTHSFYSEHGCFTIHSLPQRGELDFYCSAGFHSVREQLCEQRVDVCSIEPKIWAKYVKFGPFHRPFFWCSEKKVLCALAEVLKVHLAKEKDLFGIAL